MTEETVSSMPVERNYNFKGRVPTEVPEFRDSGGQLEKLMADYEGNREVYNEEGIDKARLPRYWATGPTGCGKTLLARRLAQELDAALFTIQGRYSMNEADLLGSPLLVDGETVWVDGPLTKALLASQEMPVVLLIDEANRARPESKSVLFSVLDDRCRVELDARGGEVIQGDPMNLISYATVNEGSGYQTQSLDLAEIRRFGKQIEMNHLGLEDENEEVHLISERSMVPLALSGDMVNVANDMRREAGDDGSPAGEINRGVPTALLINWAQTAHAYEKGSVDNPVVEAAKSSIVKPFYSDDNSSWVRDHITDLFDGAPVQNYEEWSGKDMDEFLDDQK